jgi:hypothetical protein
MDDIESDSSSSSAIEQVALSALAGSIPTTQMIAIA